MEVFSTLPRAALPWTANILTVVTLAYATWWSAGQRPAAPNAPMFATSTNVASALESRVSKDQAGDSLVLAGGSAAATESAKLGRGLAAVGHGKSPLPMAAVQPVAFLPPTAR